MKYLPVILLILLAVFGFSLEINPGAQAWQLFLGFHLAGLAALTSVSLWGLKQLSKNNKRFGFVILQLLAFRIAYFPVVVFSATVACYSELFLEEMAKYFEVVIFTAALQDYADYILNIMDEKNQFISYRLYRKHTVHNGAIYVKVFDNFSFLLRINSLT